MAQKLTDVTASYCTEVVSEHEINHRTILGRSWAKKGEFDSTILFVMLNPSTADGERDDNTIRSCKRLAANNGFNRLEVVNLFTMRSTDPRGLMSGPFPTNVDNADATITEAASKASSIVAAWGSWGEQFPGRTAQVLELLRAHDVHCLGKTKKGHPKHPLYLPRNTKIEIFRFRSDT